MTPALWTLRSGNLLLVLAVAVLGARGKAAAFALTALLLLGAEAAAVFSGWLQREKTRRTAVAAALAADLMFVLWVARAAPQWAGVIDLGALAPAVIAAVEFGAVAGALAAAVPALLTGAFLAALGHGGAANPALAAALGVRGLLFAMAPVAAGLALGPARVRAASVARDAVARLREAQIGEYLSFGLFQLRDYTISISSLTEAIALAPIDDPKRNERIERLRKSVSELGGKLSRVFADKSALTTSRPLEAAAVDLPALVKDCVDDAREAFAPNGVQVSVRVEGAVPPVRSERRCVELALLAVLQNSFSACASRGGGAVAVLLRREGKNAEIEVSDDGGGISESDKANLFEPFASAGRGTRGLGLGLFMSRRLLERIGGSLLVKSKDGYTAVLISAPIERELPKVRLADSTWAGRRVEPRP